MVFFKSLYAFSNPTLQDAQSLALLFDRESRRHFSYREGSIAFSSLQLEYYFEYAKSPTVKTICEIGFNAGHSAAVMLVANPNAHLVAFDTLQYEYSKTTSALMKELFPDRFTLIVGDSAETLPQFRQENPDFKCDLIAIDGDHTYEGVLDDLYNMREMASCRNFVLADDTGFESVNRAWQQAKNEDVLHQMHCMMDPQANKHWMMFGKLADRSWCSGYFLADDCPRWTEKQVNSNSTKCDILTY
jgi:predicted O-methyltransferase YrrM